ncbi:unnamed protein product [Ectocarpus sp. 12 AP-2014]
MSCGLSQPSALLKKKNIATCTYGISVLEGKRGQIGSGQVNSSEALILVSPTGSSGLQAPTATKLSYPMYDTAAEELEINGFPSPACFLSLFSLSSLLLLLVPCRACAGNQSTSRPARILCGLASRTVCRDTKHAAKRITARPGTLFFIAGKIVAIPQSPRVGPQHTSGSSAKISQQSKARGGS